MKQTLGEIGGRLLGKSAAGDDLPLYTDTSRKLDLGYPKETKSTPIGTVWGERLGRLHDDAAPAGGEALDVLLASGFSFVDAPRPPRPAAAPTANSTAANRPKGKGRRGPTIW